MIVAIVIFVLILLFLVVFVIQNSTLITLKLLFWQLEGVNLSLLLVLVFILGMLIAMSLYLKPINSLKKEIRQLKKKVSEKETQISELSAPKPSESIGDQTPDGGIF